MSHTQRIRDILAESARTKEASVVLAADLASSATEIGRRLKAGGTLFACGNGGSMSDALHLVGEMIGRFAYNRPGIRAVTLGCNPTSATAIANDFSYTEVLLREADALVGPGDALVAISTSGNAENVCAAATLSRDRGAFVLGLTGRDGGKLASLCDVALVVPSEATARVQEAHITLIHALCELLEEDLHPRDRA